MRTTNNSFGKLENGTINYSPIPLIVDGNSVWTNDRALYLANGYSEIVRTEQPSREGYYYTSSWEQTDEQTITEVWTEHEVEVAPPNDEPTMEERLTDLESAICELCELLA